MMICILCGKPLADFNRIPGTTKYLAECNTCGKYLSEDFCDKTSIRHLLEFEKAMVSAFTRECLEFNSPPPDLAALDIGTQLPEIIGRYSSKSVLEKLNRIVIYIGKKSSEFGKTIKIIPENDYPLTYSPGKTEFDKLVIQSCMMGLINFESSSGEAQLLLNGWVKYAETATPQTRSKKCFVAMSCANEIRNAYEDGIKVAVTSLGFAPIFIERHEHNEKICDLIVSEIKSSRFLIADVTGHRQNVYYEAGFAKGIGLEVIWTCREDEIAGAHFDTRQYNHILWADPEALKVKLINRIKATII